MAYERNDCSRLSTKDTWTIVWGILMIIVWTSACLCPSNLSNVHLSVTCPFINSSIRLHVCLSIRPYIRRSVRLHIHLTFICSSVHLSVCLFFSPSVRSSVRPSDLKHEWFHHLLKWIIKLCQLKLKQIFVRTKVSAWISLRKFCVGET